MPLYEYECTECHRRTEKIQKFSDPELTTCPYCTGPLERTVTAPAIQFKGSGWYKDLYSSAKPAPASSGDSAPPSGNAGDASTGPKTEAAPATGTTPTPAPAAAPKSTATTASNAS